MPAILSAILSDYYIIIMLSFIIVLILVLIYLIVLALIYNCVNLLNLPPQTYTTSPILKFVWRDL